MARAAPRHCPGHWGAGPPQDLYWVRFGLRAAAPHTIWDGPASPRPPPPQSKPETEDWERVVARACALLWVELRRTAGPRGRGAQTRQPSTAASGPRPVQAREQPARRAPGRLHAGPGGQRQSSSMGLLSSWLSSPSCSEEPMRLLRRFPGSKRVSGPPQRAAPRPKPHGATPHGHAGVPGAPQRQSPQRNPRRAQRHSQGVRGGS